MFLCERYIKKYSSFNGVGYQSKLLCFVHQGSVNSLVILFFCFAFKKFLSGALRRFKEDRNVSH